MKSPTSRGSTNIRSASRPSCMSSSTNSKPASQIVRSWCESIFLSQTLNSMSNLRSNFQINNNWYGNRYLRWSKLTRGRSSWFLCIAIKFLIWGLRNLVAAIKRCILSTGLARTFEEFQRMEGATGKFCLWMMVIKHTSGRSIIYWKLQSFMTYILYSRRVWKPKQISIIPRRSCFQLWC